MTSLDLYRDAALNRVDSRRMGRSLARLDGRRHHSGQLLGKGNIGGRVRLDG